MDNQTSLKLLCEILSFNVPHEVVYRKIYELSHQDWQKLYEVATKQKVSLILYDFIQKHDGREMVPQFAKERLRETYHRSLAKNLRMMHHASMVFNALNSYQIDVIALKGVFLAEAIYRNVGLRTFFDLDIMVRKEDVLRTLSYMKEMGYFTSTYYNPEEANIDIKHIPPMVKKDSPYIEIHWGILEEDEPFNIDTQGIWRRAREFKTNGVNIYALGYADLILHLCVHFSYQHHMEIGLGALYDIALVIENFNEQIDWDQLTCIAESWGVEKIIWLTFSMLRNLFNVTIPHSVIEKLQPEDSDQSIVEIAIINFIEKSNQEGSVYITPDLAQLSSTRNIFRKIRVIINRVFIPKYILGREYNISPKSVRIYFYYFVRFGDLISNYSLTLLNILNKDKNALASLEKEEIKGWLLSWYTNSIR